MKTTDNQKALALLDRESRVTLSKRDFAALTNAINGSFKPNRALTGAPAEKISERRSSDLLIKKA